jgi:hypothetical protein
MTEPTATPEVNTDPTVVTPAEVVKVSIPPAASKEIIRLYKELIEKQQPFLQARDAFNEFIRASRLALGIPVDTLWDLNADASAFTKVEDKPEGAPAKV